MKRIGLMGAGVIGYHGHAIALEETPGIEMASVYDPNPAALERMRERFPYAKMFTDQEAFMQSGIDAVTVASPAPRHLDNVRLAARHGKPVLCEKPLSMREDEIEEMIAIMDGAGLMFSTALCYRFSPVALRIRELVEEGAIGKVRALRLIYLWDLHGKYEYDEAGQPIVSPRRVGRMIEGGPMVDCGVHQIDLARWWLNSEVTHQTASAAWVDDDFEAPDHMWLHLDHDNGAHTAVEMSFAYTHTASEPLSHFSYHLIGTDGLIRYDRDHWHFEVRTAKGTQYLPGASEKNFAGMYAAWRDALETGERGNMPTGRDGLLVTRIARSATDAVIADRHKRLQKGKL